jgi:hypothetical protein
MRKLAFIGASILIIIAILILLSGYFDLIPQAA